MAREAELRIREQLSRLRSLPLLRGARLEGELERLQRQLERIVAEPSDEEIWRSVELARNPDRPYTLDYVERLLEDWFELHGDRAHGDDAAVVAGLGRFRGRTVVLVGNQKGRDVKERTDRNFGMAYPEGYGKAMRAMELANRHGFPVLSLVDIPGAYPGVTAEEHGQGGAIARSQALMARLRVPIVTCIIGEGGSGGAIATALADRVLMQENAIYTVISPEGCAAILWRGDRRDRPGAGWWCAHQRRRGGSAAGRRLGGVHRAVRRPRRRRLAAPTTCAIPHNRTALDDRVKRRFSGLFPHLPQPFPLPVHMSGPA